MDFLALPRRDLQALCKRNGVRANMTNSAMADALRSLPKVDGIEEYVKQPVPVSEPEVQAVAEEKNVGKRGNPLVRGRRAVAKSSEPVEPDENNEEEKGNAKRQSSKEDAQALCVGRRGASRRARPVPVVPQPAAVAEEETNREAKTDAPAPVVGRRGASRRARPSPAMTAQAADSEVAAGAEAEQREEVEDPKREATMDDMPALGVGRRGVRRTRAAPSVAALGGKVVTEEEQRAPIPRGRPAKAKGSSAEPITLDESDDEEKEDAMPEEEQEDAQILGVGHRGGAGRRAQAALAVAAPEAEAVEEQRPPVPRGRRVKANSAELIRMEESKGHTKPEEERGDVPAIAVGRHGARRRAPAPSEAPATRRSAAASKADAGVVAVEAVPIRGPRQCKPTMKAAAAAAAAEEKAPRRATRRGEVMSSLLQEEVQEEPQEAVGAPDMALEVVPIRATRQRMPTMKAAATAATAKEKAPPRATRRGAVMGTVLQPEAQEEVQEAVGALVSYQRCDALEEVDAQKQDEDQDVVIIENEKLMEKIPAEEPSVTDQAQEEPQGVFSDAEPVGTPVSYQRRDALEELEQAYDPRKEELNEVDTPKQNKDQVIIEVGKLMEESPAEEASVTDQECTDNSEMQEQKVDDEKCQAPLATQEELPILGPVSTVIEPASEDEGASSQDDESSSLGLLDKGACEQTCDAGEEMESVLSVQTLEAPLTGNESDANHKSEMGNFNEVTTVREEIIEVGTQEVSKEKEHEDIAELHADIVDEAAFLDCSSNISQVAEEVINEKANTAGEAINEAGHVTNEMPENTAALDEDGDKPNEVVIGNNMSQVTVTDEVVEEEKGVLISDEMLQGIAAMHDDIKDDQFETVFVQVDQVVTADNLLEQVTDDEVVEEMKTPLIVDEKQRNTATMNDEIVDDHFKTHVGHGNEQKEVVEDDHFAIFVKVDQVVTADNLLEQVTDDEVVEEMKTPLIVDEKQRNTATINEDIVDDHFKTHVAHGNEQKEVVAPKVPEVTGIDVEIQKTSLKVDEKKPSTVRMNGDVVFDHLKTDTAHADEQKEATGIVTEMPYKVLRAQEGGARKEIALLDDVTESSATDDAQEEPEGVFSDAEAVGALVSYQRCDDLEELAEASDPQNEELNEVNAPKQDEHQDLVIIEDEKLMEEIPAEEASVTDQECTDKSEMQEQLLDDEKCHAPSANHEESPILGLVSRVTEQASENSEVAVDAPVFRQQCDAMEELADASDPKKEELNEVDTPKQDEDQDVIIIEDEKLMEETIAEEQYVTHQEWTDNSEIQEQQVEDEKCHALLATHKESPILGLVSMVTEQVSQDDVGASFQDDVGPGLLDKSVCEETYDATEEMELAPGVQTLQAPLTGNESDASDANHETKMENFNENRAGSNVENVGEKNSAEPIEDLNKLSLGQLKAKLKEKLIAKKNKEAKKRVALARVDENVCRSHAKDKQQDLNLQQH